METRNPRIFDLFFSVLAGFASILVFLFFPHEKMQRAYFFPPNQYLFLICTLAAITFIYTLFIRKTSRGRFNLLIFSLAFVFSCFLVDLVYSMFKVTIPVIRSSPTLKACTIDMNGYFIDRSYQYVAVTFLSFFFLLRTGKKVTFFKFGNIWTMTGILGGNHRKSWLAVIFRISVVLLGGSLLLMYIRWDPVKAIVLPAKIIGGINNSVFEEFLFRALYLSMLVTFMKPSHANHLQAFFFSYVHLHWDLVSGTAPLSLLLSKLVLYYLIGWFCGKMTLETKGVLASCLLHSVITLGIWFSLPTF